jgi:flagellar biosynthesis GTPase FlhF
MNFSTESEPDKVEVGVEVGTGVEGPSRVGVEGEEMDRCSSSSKLNIWIVVEGEERLGKQEDMGEGEKTAEEDSGGGRREKERDEDEEFFSFFGVGWLFLSLWAITLTFAFGRRFPSWSNTATERLNMKKGNVVEDDNKRRKKKERRGRRRGRREEQEEEQEEEEEEEDDEKEEEEEEEEEEEGTPQRANRLATWKRREEAEEEVRKPRRNGRKKSTRISAVHFR